MTEEYPLVSVNVVSYNADKYIIETLDSIANQTYSNIELIISDDASSDKTVDLCRSWIQEHKSRFTNVELITVEKNTGVTANCNRALAASHGEYWKIIGSDDLLLPDCIEKCVAYMQSNPQARFLFGKQITFTGDFSDGNLEKKELPFRAYFFRGSVSAKKQYKIITRLAQVGCAPASFAQTSLLREVGGFNPRFPMNEDTPLYIHLTSLGHKLWYLDEFLVYRRIHRESIMHQKDEDAIMSKAALRTVQGEWSKYIQENSNWFWRRMSRFSQWMYMNILRNGNTKKSWKCRFWLRCSKGLNPYRWYVLYSRIIDKTLSSFGY